VSYRTGEQVTLGLHIPEEAAVNREEVEAHKV
jgi:sRNA-binding carbon storage regulator CsrA